MNLQDRFCLILILLFVIFNMLQIKGIQLMVKETIRNMVIDTYLYDELRDMEGR